ncbi:MAG: ABC transporter ATP-binding protein [Clostridia bacterium]|nr:ABC transporter ATP-binding protein [Clostridia bacterium]
MIEVKNITKKYGDRVAVKELSFSIEPGKIYGFLGPNGAGKSTTMNIITGTLAATSGTVLINGHDIYEDPIEAKKCIGYLPEIPPLYGDMTPKEFLTFVAEAKRVDYEKISRRVREVMELTGLMEVSGRLIRNLSKGYRQRVGIAQAMVGNPDIIILDEPTVGLDPLQIIEIRSLIKQLGETKTVILSSHILAEIAEICDHVMIISHGRLVADDTIENLKATVDSSDNLKLSVRGAKEKALAALEGTDGIIGISAGDTADNGITDLTLRIAKGADPRDDIFFRLADARLPITGLELEKVTLESIFLALTADDPADSDDGQGSVGDNSLSRGNEDNSDSKGHEDDNISNNDDNDDSNDKNDKDDYKPLFS